MKMELEAWLAQFVPAEHQSGAASDDEEDDGTLTAPQLATRVMELYNLPISNMKQLDTFGNDLRVPQLERKLREFASWRYCTCAWPHDCTQMDTTPVPYLI